MQMAYPQEFVEALGEAIALELMDGKTMRQICAVEGMPSVSTVYRWMDENPEFGIRCARARVIQGEVIADTLGDLEERTLSGEIDPATARVVIASRQWRASKLAPKRYGDKVAIGGADDLPKIGIDGLGPDALMELRGVIQSLAANRGTVPGGAGGTHG